MTLGAAFERQLEHCYPLVLFYNYLRKELLEVLSDN